MSNSGLLFGVLSDDAISSDRVDNPFFTITSRSIRFNHGNEVYPIRNITRINKYKVKENKMPKPAMYALAALTLLFLFSSIFTSNTSILIILAFFSGIGAAIGFWHHIKPGKFAFCIKTTSGDRRYLFSTDESFISDVIQTVTDVIENEESRAVYNIDMKEGTINPAQINVEQFIDRSVNNSGVVAGSVNTGDNIHEQQ